MAQVNADGVLSSAERINADRLDSVASVLSLDYARDGACGKKTVKSAKSVSNCCISEILFDN